MSDLIKRRLTVEVTYDLSEVRPDARDEIIADLETYLRNLHDMAVSIGAFTGNTAALVDSTTCEVDTPPGPFVDITSDMITATVKSDDDVFCFEAPAEAWLQGLSDDDLAYLCCEPFPTEFTDRFWLENEPLTQEWEAMATYIGSACDNASGGGRLIGYSVSFDNDDVKFWSWVKANRPEAWAIFREEYESTSDDAEAAIFREQARAQRQPQHTEDDLPDGAKPTDATGGDV